MKTVVHWNKVEYYIINCAQAAFRQEGRKWKPADFKLEYIAVKNKTGKWQFYMLADCKYDRVLRKVQQRVSRNLYKNHGVVYGDTKKLKALFYSGGVIDPNHTYAMFVINGKQVSLSLIDNKLIHENRGERIAYRYEKLLFHYHNITAEDYDTLSPDDERRHLPPELLRSWKRFRRLYIDTFGHDLDDYEIVTSKGIARL